MSPSQPPSRVSHYEIVRELGQGGMGIVFRARDTHLDREVALKRPRPEHLSDPRFRHRFLQEARAASRLSHPHIVPVYEVFEEDGCPWLAMQLVDGRSLRVLLREKGALPVGEVLRHGEALAGALQAAHDAHVLHRDVNPNNVLIAADGRPLLSDFGLARFFIPAGEESSATTRSMEETPAGVIVGTPGYLSPEQALGRPVDTRSDIFSLGAVLYEMCTGQPAFSRTEKGDTLDAVLHREPVPISRLTYEVPEELERIIRKALAKRPEERYQDARDLQVDLRALRRKLEVAESRETEQAVPRRIGRWGRWLAAAVVVAAVGVAAAVLIGKGHSRPAPAVPSGPRKVVAVLPFEDRTGGEQAGQRGGMVADLMSADLAESKGLRSLGNNRVQEILAGLPPRSSRSKLSEKFRELAAVDWLIAGTLYREGDSYQAVVDVFQAGSPEPLRSFRVSAPLTASLADLATARVRKLLLPGGGEERSDTVALTSPSEDANLQEFQGRRALREQRYAEAIAGFEKAVSIDPLFISAQGWLALALDQAGYSRRAREVIEEARRLADNARSPADGRLILQLRAVEARIRDDFKAEVDARSALADRYPDEPEALLALATALERAAKPDEALAISDRALALDPGDPQVHLQRATTLIALKKLDDASAEADEAERLFGLLSSEGGRGQVAMARGRLEFTRQAYAKAGRAYGDAAGHFEKAGMKVRAADAEKAEGDMELLQGNLSGAKERYDAAISSAREAGNYRLIVLALSSLGGKLYLQGDHAAAERVLREAVEEARSLDNPRLILPPLLNLAGLLNYTGRTGEGRGLAEEALQAARARGDHPREAFALSLMADADYQQGRLKDAARTYADVIRLESAPGGSRANLARSETTLAGALEPCGATAEGLEAAMKAVEMEREMANPVDLGYALVARARLMAHLARWEEAESDLREAEKIATGGKEILEDLVPRVSIARGLLAMMRGEWREAERHLEKAVDAGLASGAVGLEVPARVLASEAALRLGRPGQAVSQARKALEHPRALADERSEARAALAGALAAGGEASAAAGEARRALDEAEAMGLLLVAARAAQVLVSLPAPGRPVDVEAIRDRGRRALEGYLAGAPEDRRSLVRKRSDLSDLFTALK